MTTPRRTALDLVRLDYRKRVMTPAGNEMVVRARRKIDADSVDPIAVPLPLAIVAIWVAVRERRNHKQYQHQWVVDVFPRYEFEKARVIAEVPKCEALDLVDAHASELEAAGA